MRKNTKFKNIPIDGDIKAFSEKMIEAGYTTEPDAGTDSFAAFEGSFMGKPSTIIVFHTPGGLVYKVMVMHEYSTWSSLSSAYDDAMELYTKKYGKPSKQYAFFSEPYYKGDGFELQALRNDKCHYICVWEVPFGNIGIQLVSLGSSYYVTMGYEDIMNMELKNLEEEKKALDEI